MTKPRTSAPLTTSPSSTQWPALLLPLRLETRVIDGFLCIRVFPDQPFVDSHQAELTAEEHAAGLPLKNIVKLDGWEQSETTLELARGEWTELARRYGPNRAAWVLKSLLDDVTRTTVESGSQAIPKLMLLPERFIFLVYQGETLVYNEAGADIVGTFTLLPAPTDDDSEPTDGLFDEPSKWVTDFDAAVIAGLGIKIPLLPDHVTASELHFSEIVVIGLAGGGPSVGAQTFEEFVRRHRYSDGFEFLPYGTPTNNTAQAPSGHSESEEQLLASFDFEVLSPLTALSERRKLETASADLARALGLPNATEVFEHIRGADLAPNAAFQLIFHALWPSTGDYFFSTMLGYGALHETRRMLREYASRYLRPRGHLATIRVGNMPYGILPASRTRTYSSQDPSGWRPSATDRRSDEGDWETFDLALLRALRVLLPLWVRQAENSAAVPRAGSSADPDDEIVRLLGMAPHSIEYRTRPIVDQTLIGVLLQLFSGTLFGINSGFAGLSPSGGTDDPRTSHVAGQSAAIAAWVSEARSIAEATVALLQEMGAPGLPKDYPPLLRAFAWGDGAPLTMPLVREAAAPPDAAPPTTPPDGPETYLSILAQEIVSPLPTASNTLFYDLARRSRSLERGLPESMRNVMEVLKALLDFPILEFFNHAGTESALTALAAREPPISEGDLASVVDALTERPLFVDRNADAIRTAVGSDTVFNVVASRLRYDFSTRLEAGLQDVIDTLTYRLDAWFTALPARRLPGMREPPGQTRGLHWGAFGYLENITLRHHTADEIEADAGAGFIHAPTIPQASAAAILRSAYVSHRDDENGNAYALNLTSRRVGRGLALIDGVQQGQDLAALLGYQFERGLHDEGLDRFIDEFRARFPISPPDEEDAPETGEGIAAREVCDGRALAVAFAEQSTDVDELLTPLDSDDREVVRGLLTELVDSNDAVGDLLLYEGVFQAVQGNYDRSGAALDAGAGIGKPPEIASVATPTAGPNLSHRICLFIPCVKSDDAATTPARAAAEPTLAAWVHSMLGDLNDIVCRAEFTPQSPGDPFAYLTLADIAPAISPLDFLYMSAVLPTGDGDTELEIRLRRAAHGKPNVAPGSPILLKLDDRGSGLRSVDHALEVGRAMLDMLGSMTVATPPSLTHPDEAPLPPFYRDVDVTELIERVEKAQELLVRQLPSLNDPAAAVVLGALDVCAEFGIQEALVDSAADPSIAQRGQRVAEIVGKRDEAATRLIASARVPTRGDSRIQDATDALKALFGDSFVVLPAFDASALDPARVAAFNALTIPPVLAEDRIWLWLQQVAETHPRVRRAETFLLCAEAWGVVAEDPARATLKVAQLPLRTDADWQALPDLELRGAGRISGAQSIVAMMPESIDLTCVTGFVIDEWTETLPAPAVTTGVSFEYNQPASQAPQCFLLAVPGNFGEPEWTAEHLAGIVRDTMELAKVRLVDLDALPAVGGVFPALMFPIPSPPVMIQPITPSAEIGAGRRPTRSRISHSVHADAVS